MVMKRFQVAEQSMLPTLAPGDEVVATDSRQAVPGEVVCFPHPSRSDFWMVKRLDRIEDRGAWVTSDNQDVSATDSDAFGLVSTADLMPVVSHLDEHTFREGVDLLVTEDEALRAVVNRHGTPEFWNRRPGFEALVLLILEQQVSLESGAAVYRRVADLVGAVTPAAIIEVGEEGLRSAGTTRQKASYICGLAELVVANELDLLFDGDTVDEARSGLVAVRGIGLWTADAYLLSALRFPDMFPVGDRALQVGVRETLALQSDPTEAELELLAEQWRPIRAVAARLIWHNYLSQRDRTEPPDPIG
jgi:DNA-3-methyladenine glycosylase II